MNAAHGGESFGRPFSASSTAAEVVDGIDLSGRLIVVTGAAAGIGKETARVLGAAGADVVIAARNRGLLAAACDELQGSARGQILGLHLDLLSLRSIETFADTVAALRRPVDTLILNAAVMACPLARSSEGIESQLATNYIGHAYLSYLLLAPLLEAAAPRLISLSSTAHQMSPVVFDDINYRNRPYDAWEAYAQSKTATALLAVHLGNRLGSRGLTAHTLHPGGIRTGLLKHISWDLGAQFAERYDYDIANSTLKSIEQGAATSVWAATEPALLHQPPAYLEDCRVAPLLETPRYSHGVMGYALNPDNAERLWQAAETLSGQRLALP